MLWDASHYHNLDCIFLRVGRDVEVSPPDEQQQVNGIDNVVYSDSFVIDDCSTLPNETKCK
jgi:hypothetical protein